MAPEDQHRPRFEPPPWEAEAFERFRREREQARAQTELEQDTRALCGSKPGDTDREAPAEAKVQAMLEQLRAEETSSVRAGRPFVYAAICVLGALGLFVIVQGAALALRAQQAAPSGRTLAAAAAAIMVLAGAGCIAGAVGLYRKHSQ